MMATAHNIEFDDLSHTYRIGHVIVPSVTQVLEDVGIIDYSSLPSGVRMMALERGRMVHQACQFSDEDDLGAVDESLSGYLEAWVKFRRETGFSPSLIEHRGYSQKHGYAGMLDRRGVMAGVEVLLDIKTTCAPYWTAYQTAAYANFFESPARQRRMAVELHTDGDYRVHEYRCSDFSKHFAVFQSALTVFNAKRQ